ncbi:MAG: chlorite dismutase family protein [Elusimicrobiota bacterium]
MEKSKSKTQFMRFAFYRLDPVFRKLDPNVRLQAKEEALSVLDRFKDTMILRSYSLIATRADIDFLLWQIVEDVDVLEDLASKLMHTTMGPYLRMGASYFALSKGSVYIESIEKEAHALHGKVQPGTHPYLFVCPIDKSGQWYKLSDADRRKMVDEHVAVSVKHPSIKTHVVYSHGIDDRDVVIAFEANSIEDFHDAVLALRDSKINEHVVNNTPVYTCVNRDPKLIFDIID